MRRNMRLSAMLFAITAIATEASTASAQGVVPVEDVNYTVIRGSESNELSVQIASGVNMNTRALAAELGTDPYTIRAENPTATLALCNKGGKYQLSSGIRSVEGRRTNAIWANCPEADQYVYILPKSMIALSGMKRRSHGQERVLLDRISRCTDASCATTVARELAVNVSDWNDVVPAAASSDPSGKEPMPSDSRGSRMDLVPIGADQVREAGMFPRFATHVDISAFTATFQATVDPWLIKASSVLRNPMMHRALLCLGALGFVIFGLIRLYRLGLVRAMRLLKAEHNLRIQNESELKSLRLEKDRLVLAGQHLATERDYYKGAREILVQELDKKSVAAPAPAKGTAGILQEREAYRRSSEHGKRLLVRMDMHFRHLVRDVYEAMGKKTAPVYIDRMPVDLLAKGLVEAVSDKVKMPDERRSDAPAALTSASVPGHVTQRLYTVVPPKKGAIGEALEDSGIRLKDSGLVTESGSEVMSGLPTGTTFPSTVRTERSMPAVALPLVLGFEPPVEHVPDETAPHPWYGTMMGIGKRRVPKRLSQRNIVAA